MDETFTMVVDDGEASDASDKAKIEKQISPVSSQVLYGSSRKLLFLFFGFFIEIRFDSTDRRRFW